MSLVVELFIAVFSIVCAVIGFYTKRLYVSVDSNTKEIKRIESMDNRIKLTETSVNNLASKFQDHRVDSALTYPSRKEVDDKITALKDDIRGMIAPVRTSLQNVENYLRDSKK